MTTKGCHMSATRAWTRGARLAASALLGVGLVIPTVTACSSASTEETEQVEEQSDDGEDLEESDPEPDIEE